MILSAGIVWALIPVYVSAQGSDYLTTEEIELIRINQEIDKRMEIYVKAVERRFVNLPGAAPLTQKDKVRLEKEVETWGVLPDGSNEKLLSQIDNILDEAISKIDDVAERDVKSDLFPRAVHILADAARRFIPRLNTIAEATKDPREIALASSSIGYCNDIIEASAKAKKPEDSKKQKKERS